MIYIIYILFNMLICIQPYLWVQPGEQNRNRAEWVFKVVDQRDTIFTSSNGAFVMRTDPNTRIAKTQVQLHVCERMICAEAKQLDIKIQFQRGAAWPS